MASFLGVPSPRTARLTLFCLLTVALLVALQGPMNQDTEPAGVLFEMAGPG